MKIIIGLFILWLIWAIWDKYFKHSKKHPTNSKYDSPTDSYLKRKHRGK